MQLLRSSKWFILAILGLSNAAARNFRPPAVPLIANSPYFSLWSMADRLIDDVPVTGPEPRNRSAAWFASTANLTGFWVTNQARFRRRNNGKYKGCPPRTIYQFEAVGVGITLTFMTPACRAFWM
jgi:hypothetical protein